MTELDTADGIDARDAIDPPRIWLQNAEDANHVDDRLWCAHPVWPDAPEDGEPVEYIRIDLHNSALRSAHEAGKREGIEAAAEIARERVALWEPWSEERTQEAKHLADAILSLSTSPTGGWRDIKDAPKDGTHVIVTDGLGVYGSAWFHPEERVWLDCDGCVPTQFQPLPAPPADGEGSR